MERSDRTSNTGRERWQGHFGTTALFTAAVFLACLIGIYSRLPDTLAVLWLANALLLGLLVRNPSAATVPTWLGAAGAYLGADLLTGSDLASAALLNAANLLGVLAGFYAFRRMAPADRQLTRALSVTFLVGLATLASAVEALLGGVARVVLFGGTWGLGWLEWFAAELLNYMVLLPLVLTFPAAALLQALATRHFGGSRALLTQQLRRVAIPVAMLAVMLPGAWLIGGFGALAFTTPALVVAGLLTDVFTTSVLVAVSTVWTLALAVEGRAGVTNVTGVPVATSTQIGLSMLAIGPLAVACAIAERKRAQRALHEAVTLDDLTGAYRRDEFRRLADAAAAAATRAGLTSSVLMMDLDHFKRLNDTFGHQAGDQALSDFGQLVRTNLRAQDLFARLGGEEFAVLMPGMDSTAAAVVAETIRGRQQDHTRKVHGNLGATVSIGLSCTDLSTDGLSGTLGAADAALYRAKTMQRNQVVVGGPSITVDGQCAPVEKSATDS